MKTKPIKLKKRSPEDRADYLQEQVAKKHAALCLERNRRELAEEDLECAHRWLDDQGAPREDPEGKQLSIVGRTTALIRCSQAAAVREVADFARVSSVAKLDPKIFDSIASSIENYSEHIRLGMVEVKPNE